MALRWDIDSLSTDWALTMRTPYLIQRATIITPLVGTHERLSRAVDFDYMGSAEFEFGALPASFKRMRTMLESMKVRALDTIEDAGRGLRVYSAMSDDEFMTYKNIWSSFAPGNCVRRSQPISTPTTQSTTARFAATSGGTSTTTRCSALTPHSWLNCRRTSPHRLTTWQPAEH